jgi:hypothetical protein
VARAATVQHSGLLLEPAVALCFSEPRVSVASTSGMLHPFSDETLGCSWSMCAFFQVSVKGVAGCVLWVWVWVLGGGGHFFACLFQPVCCEAGGISEREAAAAAGGGRGCSACENTRGY